MTVGEFGVNVDSLIHARFEEAQVVGHAIPLGDGAASRKEGDGQIRFFDINRGSGEVIVFTADDSAEESQFLETDEAMTAARKILIGNREKE